MYDARVSAEHRPSDGLLIVTAGLVFAIAAALGVVRQVGASPVEWGVEGVVASLALVALLATPGVLVLLARADRPSLLVTAGTVLLPCSLISLAGATLPLLIPAVMLLVVGARRSDARGNRPCAPVAVTTLVVLVLVVVAGLALFAHDDPRTYSTPTSSGETSDVITVAESLLCLGLLGLAALAAWYLAAPLQHAGPAGARDST
jgi:hypothetical protein